MRRSVRAGDPGVRIPPILLDGPPGIGKSAWARSLGNLVSTPTLVYEATIENASFGLVGNQRSWGNSHPGRLVNDILSHRVGNPVVVVDEVEKSGRATSTKGQTYSLTDALLTLLEPLSASNWSCPYFEVKFDMSFVMWVMTSNNYRRLPEPLLSRCPPVRLRALTHAELIDFAKRHGEQKGLDSISTDIIAEAIQRCGPSAKINLRTVVRMIERAVSLQDGVTLFH
jgi:ATP-dependent Lon protease